MRERVGDRPVFLSFDVDFLDPAYAPGTGTPEVAGFSTAEAIAFLRSLKGIALAGADVVEVSPPYDGPGADHRARRRERRLGAARAAGGGAVSVTVCDVGPRDGLQNEDVVLAPAVRAELCNRLAAAGVPRIEAVSFVRDDRVPAMAGAEEVVAGLERRDGTVFAGLVLNEPGYDRLKAAGLEEAHLTFAATESFSRGTRMPRSRRPSQPPRRCSRALRRTASARR